MTAPPGSSQEENCCCDALTRPSFSPSFFTASFSRRRRAYTQFFIFLRFPEGSNQLYTRPCYALKIKNKERTFAASFFLCVLSFRFFWSQMGRQKKNKTRSFATVFYFILCYEESSQVERRRSHVSKLLVPCWLLTFYSLHLNILLSSLLRRVKATRASPCENSSRLYSRVVVVVAARNR